MESAIVIKIKHEETLRRFNARIVDGELELNMDALRGKILALFKFTPDTELILTYVDEDNDVVTLDDDDDLCDVVRQSLNPLRITVKLGANMSGRSSARTSGTTTPVRSPRMPQPSQNLSVLEILNSVPEPIRGIIARIWTDLLSTGTPTGQTIADLVQHLPEMGLQYLNQLTEVQAAAQANRPASQDPGVAKVEGAASDARSSTGSASSKGKDVFLSSESKEAEPKNDKDKEVAVNVNGGAKALAKQVPGLEVLKAALDSTNANPPPPVQIESSKNKTSDKFGEPLSSGKVVNLSDLRVLHSVTGDKDKDTFNKPSEPLSSGKVVNLSDLRVLPATNAVTSDKEGLNKPNESTGSKLVNAHAFPCYPTSPVWSNLNSLSTNLNSETKDVFQTDLGNSSGSDLSMNECPFSGLRLVKSPATSPHPSPLALQKERKNNLYIPGSGIVFHRGVRCDGCGVHPITGPRFKSKVKDDYDLCSICFSQIGNDNDYIRMDRPVTYRHPYSLNFRQRVHSHAHPPVFRCGVKPGRPKLDSRFIQDVNILDGTLMAPSTPFTKIWRMRNNGSVVWPQGTQLVWIGGDKLSDAFSVAIEIPASGLAVDDELDVAVDFVAPDRPGRYISYWRMASPSGQKFGQRVWVLIQVDASSKEMPYEGFRGFNLNLPPVSNGMHGPEIISVNPEPMVEDSLPDGDHSNGPVQLVEPVADASPEKEQEANFPINDSLLVGDVAGSSPVPGASCSVSYPIIDLSPVAPSPSQSPVTLVPASPQDVKGKSEVEETLLRDLEEMGFKQVDLNKEILRLNEYDLEKSVDDLCGVSGWDPILEELHEMGFCDKATNTKLLQKNNGSIKRVVMDLLAGEE